MLLQAGELFNRNTGKCKEFCAFSFHILASTYGLVKKSNVLQIVGYVQAKNSHRFRRLYRYLMELSTNKNN